MAHIFVIAGHGAGDPGAIGNGYQEAERVRALANRIKALGGDNVTLGDTSRNWYADKGISSLNIPKDWCIIELHMDSASASARGGHVIIKSGYTADVYDTALANFIGGILPGRAQLIVGRSNLANPNRAAAKGYNYRLVEFGFITNATDVSIFNNRMDDIARGVLSAFGISSGAPAGWVLDDTGWWYRDAGGGYPVSCWRQIGNDWYYFDSRGYAVSGQWIQDGGHWYYLKEDCRMVKGWIKLGDTWFYLRPTAATVPVGSMATGWLLIDGFWYFLSPEYRDDVTLGGMLTGFFDDGDYTYYCRTTAENGKPEGSMVTGWLQLEDSWYYCNKDNDCQPVGSIFKNHWHEENGERYYLKDDGKMTCDETLVISGKEYSFDSSGAEIG